jgi:hypothetical protein
VGAAGISDLWACEELRDVALGDARLTARLFAIAATLADHPEASVPQACGTWTATKATYRFFSNPRVQMDKILRGHRKATLRRIAGRDLVLCVQDTTVLDFTAHPRTRGLGATGAARSQGLFMHSALAVSVEGVPLGLLGAHLWARPEDDKPSRRDDIRSKESGRWLAMLERSTAGIPPGTCVLTVADRESDIAEFLVLAQQRNRPLLIRAAHDRAVAGTDQRLWQAADGGEVLGVISVKVPRRPDQPERLALLAVQLAQLELAPPKDKPHLPSVRVSAILAREMQPPPDTEPVHWLLLTTLPVHTLAQAHQCLLWYTYRWRIERFHFTLKSGCRIEKLQLEDASRLRRALAVYCVVAWRLLFLTYVAREHPQQPCTAILTQEEWQALWCRIHHVSFPPATPPDVRTAVRMIAQLGGFLGRKGDGEPGVKVLWRGFRRLADIVADWKLFRPSG